jgi:putative spermidine/putrescine transport system substrate-binding protein
MSGYRVSRRNFMKGTAGGLALTSLGSPFGAQQAFAADLASEELRTVGLSVTVQERILADFKAKSGVKAVSGKGAIFPDVQTELLSGSNAYDCWETIGERLPAVIETNKIESIPVSALKSWANIRDTFTKPNPKWGKGQQIAGQIWTDDKQTALWMVPTVYNYDSIGYRPDLVSKEEASTWTAIFDDKFKGKTGLNVDPLIAFGQAVLAMNSLGLLQVPNPGNPDKKSIDEASKFLVSKKKNGQFRALWGDFGELVNLLASGEMILADAWQPAVMAVKAQGVQCTYAVPKEGYRAWSIGVSPITGTPNKEAVIAYAD